MNITVRTISPNEYPLLEEFLYHAIYLPPGAEPVPREIIFQPEIFIYLKDFGGKDDHGVVAEQDGKIVGAAWTRIIPAYGHIDDATPELAISVLPEYRGHGIGTKMMTRLFTLLRRNGYTKTSLSVQQDNPAVRFYQRLGYEIIDTKRERADQDDYIMVKTLGVVLRCWKAADAAALAATINNKKVQDNLRDGIPFPYTEKDGAEFIDAALSAEKDTQYAFAIVYDGSVIGSIGVFRKENIHRLTAEMGYYIGEPYWGRGFMTDAVKQMCAYIFENTDIIRIYAEPFSQNTASCRVLEKAGFQFEGVLRKNAVKNGQIIDMMMYAIVKPEVTA